MCGAIGKFLTIKFLTFGVSDPHKFSCGPGSRIQKMSMWIRIQTPHFLFGSGSKGGKNLRRQLKQTNFQLNVYKITLFTIKNY